MGFDPIHSGHIAYLQAAKKLGDLLIVGVNSDEWLTRKKGRAFMPIEERVTILRNIVGVNFVIVFNDADNTAKHAIWMVRQSYPQARIIFANGGDRTNSNIPEMDCHDDNIEFVFGVGGNDKKNSSSWILQNWKEPKTQRPWGHYRVLYEIPGTKVKELVVDPGKSLSCQRHASRNELWFVADGVATVNNTDQENDLAVYQRHQYLTIPQGKWHMLSNTHSEPLRIIEIQYGTQCVEEDIERK